MYPIPPKLVLPNSITPEFRVKTAPPADRVVFTESQITNASNIGSMSPQPPIPDLYVSERTANAAQNVEKEQWLSSYQRSFTGNGPMPPIALDNCGQKLGNVPNVDQPLVCLDFSYLIRFIHLH